MKGFLCRVHLYLSAAVVFVSSTTFAQTGPGGVGTADGASSLNFWFRADANVTSSSGSVSTWGDASGYGHNLFQNSAGNRPTITTNPSLNNQSVIRYDGASTQHFNSSVNGPGVNNLTLFMVTNGSNYQSLIRFQGNNSNYVVYPWNQGSPSQSFLLSTDPGGLASGLVASVNNIGAARYRINTTNGMQTFLNGAVNAQRNSLNVTLPTAPLYSGKYFGNANENATADVGEMIIYYSALNDAQMVIVQNYLSAKFNSALSANDVYTMDDNANGDFDYDVAGIGRTSSTDIHNDSRGTGFIRILNPTDLGDGEYFMWGSNGLPATATNTSDIPLSVVGRFERVWRVSEATGDVGNIDIQIDVTGLADFASLSTCDAASAIRLLVDTNNNGTFADQTPISGATNIGGNIYRFVNVSVIGDGMRFTIALAPTAVTGPGGVGATNGTGSLAMWMDAGKGITSSSGAVTNWADQSGHGINAVPPTAAARPTYTTSALNGRPVLGFATNDILELSSNINTTTPSMFMVANKTTTGTGYMTMLTLQQNLWLAQGGSADQWGMYVDTDALITNLNTTYRVMSAHERAYNDIDLYDAGVGVTRTNGTALHGKALGSIGANNNGTSNTGMQFFNGNIAEIVLFNTNVNSAQRIIISNYLAAKYGLPLSANDVYTRDEPANGDFDYEVAGIGRVNSTNLHSDARGTGLVRISNPTSLGDGEYFMWGHNNLIALGSDADIPSGVQKRWLREWSVSETGEVGNVDIQFEVSGQGSVTASDLRLLIDHNGNGIYNEGGTIVLSGAVALSCNNYIFNGVSSINDGMRFTIGTANSSQTTLPIELISFEGDIVNGAAQLKWETASEFNNDYFTVERSTSGEKFVSLFDVRGSGTTSLKQSYTAIDNTTPAGVIYYRLKQTDFDGVSTYSNVIKLRNEGAQPKFTISPNPVKVGEEISIRATDLEENTNVAITVFDMLGRQVPVSYSRSYDELNVSTDLIRSPGVYVLKVVTPTGSRTERIYVH